MRELRNETAEVIAAVRSGERITLTVHGQPVADIVPHQVRRQWLSGTALREQLTDTQADSALTDDLALLAGDTLADL